ncbi:MAG TPA: PepSY domain-containing protein, partial [Kineosporiaceae bacterium]|nr:PepSY domain-containing protein [Kineosporiaceae bacterium]
MSTISDHDPDVATDDQSDITVSGSGRTASSRRGAGLFRAFWRWHFYAALLVVPILLMLAVTGLVYLFRWQIDPAMHPGVLMVSVPAHGAPLPLVTQESAVKAAYPNKPITAVQQSAEDRATYFTIAMGENDSRNVYVNPYTARVLGTLAPDDLLSNIAVKIHGNIVFGKVRDLPLFHDPIVGKDLVLGDIGDRIIELAACWAMVMTLTGYYLFLRGRGARLKRVAAGAKAATLRNRHGVIGATLGVGILFLVVSGLPWTGLWGGKVQQWAAGHGLSLWGDDPGATSTLGAKLAQLGSTSAPAPWAEGGAPMPASMPGMEHAPAAGTAAGGPIT